MATCFVVMGFGKKTDFESGRTLDLDKSYLNVIKPAVKAAGLDCVRADEIVHAGVIDLPMYEQLLRADVVIADLSTNNKNAFYELGVRHALRPEHDAGDQRRRHQDLPVRRQPRRRAPVPSPRGGHRLQRSRALPRRADRRDQGTDQARSGAQPGQPCLYLPDAAFRADGEGGAAPGRRCGGRTRCRSAAGADADAERADAGGQRRGEGEQLREGRGASRRHPRPGEGRGRQTRPSRGSQHRAAARARDLQERAADEAAALNQARELLDTLGPSSSNDTETLGLWGSVHKRLWLIERQVGDLNEAIRAHERGFYLRNDYYNGINLAYLLNVRAAEAGDLAERIADYVGARRIRREVLTICDAWLAANKPPADGDPQATSEFEALRYWVLATRGEALFGLEDPLAEQALQSAYSLAPKDWMRDSTQKQMESLKACSAVADQTVGDVTCHGSCDPGDRLGVAAAVAAGCGRASPEPQVQRAEVSRMGDPRIIPVVASRIDDDRSVGALVCDDARRGRRFVFLSGGALEVSNTKARRAARLFYGLTMLTAEGLRLGVGRGGGAGGTCRRPGTRARRASHVSSPGHQPAREIPPSGTTPIHAITARSSRWTTRTGMAPTAISARRPGRCQVFARLADGKPSVAVVANGGGDHADRNRREYPRQPADRSGQRQRPRRRRPGGRCSPTRRRIAPRPSSVKRQKR